MGNPRNLLLKAGELLNQHKKLKDKVRRMEKEVKHLEKLQQRKESGSPNLPKAPGIEKTSMAVGEDAAAKNFVSLYSTMFHLQIQLPMF